MYFCSVSWTRVDLEPSVTWWAELGPLTELRSLSCCLQMGLEGLQQEYVRLEEHPFTSEQKWMAVRCVHRTLQVRLRPGSSLAWLLA